MIRIITGGIGSGKTRCCLDEIENIHNTQPEVRCLMLVNDHYSHEAEKLVVSRFGAAGLNNIEVITLKKLSRELLENKIENQISAAGKAMIIKRAIDIYLAQQPQISPKFRRALGRDGFVRVLAQMISEMKNYNINFADLYAAAEIAEDSALVEKMEALARMYEIYTEIFDSINYIDSSDNLEFLAQAVLHCAELKGAYMWIDEFDEFLPQQMRVIEALHKTVKQLTVSVGYPMNNKEQRLYSEILRTLKKIEALDESREYIDCGEHLKQIKSDEIKFMLNNWNIIKPYSDKIRDIKVFEAKDAYSEAEYVAEKIVDLVRERGYRFRDIAVICGNEDEYGHLLDTVFDEYEIPSFYDKKINLSDHPIAMQILSVFDIFERNFDYEAVFRYLKSGFIYEKSNSGKVISLDRDELDSLENFVLKHGIRYKSRWFSSWNEGYTISGIALDNTHDDTEEIRKINKLREKVIMPLRKYDKNAAEKAECSVHVAALYELLEDINLYDGLRIEIKKLNDAGLLTEAERFEQIWDLILDVTEQLEAVMGKTVMSRKEFEDYIRAGIAQCEIRIIPSGIDRVYVGTAERNAADNIKVMFVTGANEGTFPGDITMEGFLSNSDRDSINGQGVIMVAPDTRGRLEKRRYGIYKTMALASEQIYISYALKDINGSKQGRSRLVNDVLRRFEKIEIEDDSGIENKNIHISSPKVTIHKLIGSRINLKQPIAKAVLDYYEERGLYPRLTEIILNGISSTNWSDNIDQKYALELYGNDKIEYSASRLNAYALCPYKYFMQYGLKLQEREVWDISPRDVGTYIHSVIEGFCRRVEGEEKDLEKKAGRWRDLDQEQCNQILTQLFKDARDKIENSEIGRKGKTIHIMHRLEKVVSNAVRTVHYSLSRGKYVIAGEEQKFNLNINEKVGLRGLIDRLDICYTDKYNGIRVIDYKTGADKFDIVNIKNGVDMQMVLYAAAAKELYEEADPEGVYKLTGMYYNHVRSDFAVQNKTDSADKSGNIKPLDGMTFMEDINDTDTLYDMDEGIQTDNESEFLNIKLNKDGSISKKCMKNIGSFEDGERLIQFVKETAVKFDDEIRSEGRIKPNPYNSKTKDACRFCQYSQVCGLFGKIEKRQANNEKNGLEVEQE